MALSGGFLSIWRRRPPSGAPAAPARASMPAIAAGFVLVLALMLFLVLAGYARLAGLKHDIEGVLHRHTARVEALSAMRDIVRERTLSLYAMFITRDPFERDAAYLRFTGMVDEFMALRGRIEALELSPRQRALYDQALTVIRTTQPLQADIAARLLAEQTGGVRGDLLRKDLPHEQELLAIFGELIRLERSELAEATAALEDAQRRAEARAWTLGPAALALGVLVAVTVARRTRHIEAELFAEKERAEVTLHSIGDAVITTDETGCVRYLNPVAEQLTGWRHAQAVDLPLDQVYRVINETTRLPLPHAILAGPLAGRVVSADRQALLVARNGGEYAVEDTAAPIRDASGEVRGAVLVFRDVTRARHLARQLSWQAAHDPLTGLINRREFEARLQTLLERAAGNGPGHALLYLDLDQFKVVNDTCGHVAGDALLKQLAAALRPVIRESDTLARLGGDEFGVLLTGCQPAQAGHIAQKLRETVQQLRFAWQDKTFRLGVSIGLVAIGAGAGTVAELLSAADAACYLAKEKGRNRVWRHEPGDAEQAQRHGEMQWIARLDRALEEDRFVLFQQRIERLGAGDPPELRELLLRLRDDGDALVPPMAFLPAAERYGRMPAIDGWVVRAAFEWLAAHPRADAILSVNLSGQSLGDERFLAQLLAEQARTGAELGRVCFEITETAAISQWNRALHFIATLKARGARFALDDFGSGMSSFAYLRRLPVDFVKIDGGFVRELLRDPMDAAVVETIARLAHVAGMRVIAEFVENAAIRERLAALGVDYAQGYAIHVPAPLGA